MSLTAGMRLGPYEILSPLGAGGMGEVYRARDTRLARDVAIKVLPAPYASDPGRLRRFEQEAQAASGLNHPNIVAVYDVGRADAVSYIAMELVDGKTVRDLTSSGPLPFKRALSIAAQVADGLSKAHAAGIVHRDLKPENLMVSSDGFVKILDFGLAKLVEDDADGGSGVLTAAGPRTASGIVVGTVGYMSPEQASGAPLDFRSDQFALGSVLYEMVTGRRAFARATPVDTLSAILHEEPEPAAALRPDTPTALRWLVERCLAKEREERYASTRDLARDLATLRDRLGEASGAAAATAGERRKHRGLGLALAAATLGAGFLLASLLGKGSQPPLLQWEPLSFRRGMIWSGRFAPDGQTVVYSAAWDGDPVRLFATRPGAAETRALDLPSAKILGISPKGEMAFLRDPRFLFFFLQPGTLARAALEGGVARDLLEDVDAADWSPNGSELAVARRVSGKTRLEYPIGKLLYETDSPINSLRVSPDGAWIAFFEYPEDLRAFVAAVHVADGKKRVLSEGWSPSSGGLAWSSDGNEVWFTAQTEREQRGRPLHAVTLAGKSRQVTSVPGQMRLFDIAPDGRALVARWDVRLGVRGFGSQASEGRDLSWLDRTFLQDLSNDGRTILFTDHETLFLRRTDGSPPVRLGEGYSFGLGRISPDGKWVLTVSAAGPRTLVLVPTGAGEIRRLDAAPTCDTAEWFPDGERILCGRDESGGRHRLLIVALETGKASATALPDDLHLAPGMKMVSPDGSQIANLHPNGRVRIFSLDTGRMVRQIPAAAGSTLIGWAEDGRHLFLYRIGDVPDIVQRLDIDTGTLEAWKELTLEDLAGLIRIHPVLVTPDGRSWAFSYSRVLSDLYVVEGLK